MCNIVSIPLTIYKPLSSIITLKLKGILSLSEVNIPFNKKQDSSKKINISQSIEKLNSVDKIPDSKDLYKDLLNWNSSNRLTEIKELFKKNFSQTSEEEASKFYEFFKKVKTLEKFINFFLFLGAFFCVY